jgi:hypothetical protein
MKQTLAYDKISKQFRCDVGKPPRRFYLGGDTETASRRKLALVAFWDQSATAGWTENNVKIAKAIAKDSTLAVTQVSHESDEDYQDRLVRLIERTGGSVKIQPTATIEDWYAVQAENDKRRIEELEGRLKQLAGPAAVEGLTITVRVAIDAYVKHRSETQIDPDTGGPTEHSKTQGNVLRFAARLVEPDLRLTELTFTRLHTWCSSIAARPLSKKTGRPISRATVGNALKAIRAFVRWAGRNYGWQRPDEWKEATLVKVRPTKDERRDDLAKIGKHYTLEEVGVLWRHAIASERMLLLLALNFGGAQAEIIRLMAEDVAGEETAALRGKTGVLGRWLVWPETRALAATEFAKVPRNRQAISNKWCQLLDRIRRDRPDFKLLSFKWLRKTGSSFIRKIAGGEIASLYISHGQSPSTADDLLDIYAAADWTKVVDALAAFREQLLPHLVAEAPPARTYIPLGTIDTIRQMWIAGKSPDEIIEATGKSRATCYRYRPDPNVPSRSQADGAVG